MSDTERMRGAWDQYFKERGYASIVTKQGGEQREEFYKTAQKDIEDFVLPFLTKHGLRDCKGLTILDLGCGTGRMTRVLANIFTDVIGTDVSKEMIRQAKEDHRNTSIQFFATSGRDLQPVEDESVDVCFSYATLQHASAKGVVWDNLRDVYRVMKKKGIAKIEVRGEPGNPPGHIVWFHSFERLAFGLALWRRLLPVPFLRRFNPLYGVCLKEGEIQRKLKEIGFQNIETMRIGGRHLWLEAQK